MDIFTALAEPNRRQIVELLAKKGQLSASDIFNRFEVSAPAISQHLKVLREARLVKVEKRAQQRIYAINPQSMQQLESWAKQIMEHWTQRLDAFEEVLNEAKEKMLIEQKKKSKNSNQKRKKR